MAKGTERVYRDKHGNRWQGVYVRYTKAGKISGYFAIDHAGGAKRQPLRQTPEEAREDRRNLRRVPSAQRTKWRGDERITEEWLELLLEWQDSGKNLHASSINGYRKTVRYHLLPWLETHRWTTRGVTTADMQEFVKHVGADGKHAAWQNAVKLMLIVGRGLVEGKTPYRADNPARGLESKADKKSVRNEQIRSQRRLAGGEATWLPTLVEIESLLELISSDLYRCWFRVLAFTGLRPSEAAGLMWDRDIDLNRKILVPHEPFVQSNTVKSIFGVDVRAPDAAERIERKRREGDRAGKTMAWNRSVPIIEPAEAVLHQLQDRHRNETPWVFPAVKNTGRGTFLGSFPLNYEHTQTTLRRASQELGNPRLVGVRQYDLRHYFGTMMIAAEIPIFDVAKFMGDDVETVKRTYIHTSESAVANAVAKASRFLNQQQASA